MAGERSLYFVEVAERGAQRIVERLAMIADRYGLPIDPGDDVITFAEMLQELQERGHYPPGADCTSPVCEKGRRMIANAMAVVAQQPQRTQ